MGVQFKTTDGELMLFHNLHQANNNIDCNGQVPACSSTKLVSIGELEMCVIHWRVSFSFHAICKTNMRPSTSRLAIFWRLCYGNVYLMINVDFLWRKNTFRCHIQWHLTVVILQDRFLESHLCQLYQYRHELKRGRTCLVCTIMYMSKTMSRFSIG